MAITVKVNDEIKHGGTFTPWLGRHERGTVVFFTGPHEGVVLALGEHTDHYVGEYIDDWIITGFSHIDPTEYITLSNSEES